MFGGFELTEYVPSLEDYYHIGKDIVCYKDVDEAELLIRYYLENDDEREAIKKRGIEVSRQKHVFKSRIMDFMLEVERYKGMR